MNAGKGKRALAAELRNKGVDNEVITEALAGIDAGAERQRAEQFVRDKLRREKLGDDDDTKVARRLVGMLARRGYSQTMAFDVVTAELASETNGGASNVSLAFCSGGCAEIADGVSILHAALCEARPNLRLRHPRAVLADGG